MNRIEQSYNILDRLRLPNGMYLASTSNDYHYTWLRDSFYISLPYLDKNDNKYEATYHGILDILRSYEWKIDYHIQHKPEAPYQYIHPRYDVKGNEINEEWGNAQNDAIGAVLFGIGEGVKAGKKILRDEKDREIVQKLVWYLNTLEYWQDKDQGMWEENTEVHASSIGACIAGLKAVKDVVYVPDEMIGNGMEAIDKLFPYESETKPVDLAQLSLIYPYKIIQGDKAFEITERMSRTLGRGRGVIRYLGDSYYSTIKGRDEHSWKYYGREAEWCFGIPWLSLCFQELGDYTKAQTCINWTEELMLEDGSLPELYYSGTDEYNGNTPLGWANSMYILAKEQYEKKINQLNAMMTK